MLRQFIAVLFVVLVTCGLFLQDAEAGRFGGGRSFGYSRSASSFSRSAPSSFNSYSRSQQPFGQRAAGNRWFGPIAGLLTGGLLASLFMSHGIGSGIMSWLLIGVLMFMLISFFKNRSQSAQQYRQPYQPNAYQSQDYNQNNFARDAAAQFMRNSTQSNSSYANTAYTNSYPVGFDAPTFLRDAKVQFIRLQAAYDKKDLNDIRDFTMPEVFAEIQMQLHERGDAENKTNVMSLEAELLDVESAPQMISGTEMQTMIASVKFSGLIQEDRNSPAAIVNEIWHFKKEIANSRWLVAGVQQA